MAGLFFGRNFYMAFPAKIVIASHLRQQIPNMTALGGTINNIGTLISFHDLAAFPAMVYIASNTPQIDPIMTALS